MSESGFDRLNRPIANGEMIVYRRADGAAVQLRTGGETIWLTYNQMADLYGTSSENIIQIVRRVLADGEVSEATANSELVVRQEGNRQVRREIRVFNLDMILAVGYRVSTSHAVLFRQWATSILKEYLLKGAVIDDERLKNPGAEPDYFDEIVARIRAIRASEKRFYQKVRDLFAQTSADYDPKSGLAKEFFATIQNKLLYAITGKTAAELVRERVDTASSSFGMTTWKGDRPVKADAIIAKNYLTETELAELDTLTTQFLDFAELQANRRLVTTMAQWVAATDRLLAANSYPTLDTAGSVSHQIVEDIVGELWPSFVEQRRERDKAEALAQEEADIALLIEISKRRP
ncbi:MAG: virulence RhuM family protein [Cellulomonadaceae bacterium]|jgi:hypothetical protein|nr:virulence RhuM family protein [Cellulomonadaceae bacterium]